jgi:hypothetical protein
MMPRRPTRALALPGIASLAVLGADAARAVPIAGSATGVIAEHAETDAAGEQVFGLDGPGLLGQPFRIDFSYDPDLAPADSDPAGERGEYASSAPGQDWLQLSITVNGHTELLTGDFRRAFVLDSPPSDPIPEDLFQLSTEFFFQSPDGNVHQREFLDFILFVPAETLASADLPADFASDQILRVLNSAAFRINDFELDPDTHEVLSSRYVSFNLDIQEISASPVPEPGTGALLALGLLGLAFATRDPGPAPRRSG